jgi:hypothetical protein
MTKALRLTHEKIVMTTFPNLLAVIGSFAKAFQNFLKLGMDLAAVKLHR